MSEYWVVGGVFTSTEFDELVAGEDEERHGPFWSYSDAERAWQRLSWQKVDKCQVRYQIVEEATLH